MNADVLITGAAPLEHVSLMLQRTHPFETSSSLCGAAFYSDIVSNSSPCAQYRAQRFPAPRLLKIGRIFITDFRRKVESHLNV